MPSSKSIVNGRTYIIKNVKSNTVLDLSATDGGTVSGWQRHDGANQKWTMDQDKKDYTWRLWNNFNGSVPACLAVEKFDMGAHVVAAINEEPFRWNILLGHSKNFPSNMDTFRIFFRDSNLNVDLAGCGVPTNGNRLEMWPVNYENGDHQLWTFEEVQCDHDYVSCSISFTPPPFSSSTIPPPTTTPPTVESGLCPVSKVPANPPATTTPFFSPPPATTPPSFSPPPTTPPSLSPPPTTTPSSFSLPPTTTPSFSPPLTTTPSSSTPTFPTTPPSYSPPSSNSTTPSYSPPSYSPPSYSPPSSNTSSSSSPSSI